MPVSSYGPELFELFKQASQREISIPFTGGDIGFRKATTLRFRCHRLRVAMRKENHHLTTIANGVIFSIRDGEEGKTFLVARPADTNFDAELAAAGIVAPSGAEVEPSPIPEVLNRAADLSEQGLAQLFGDTEEETER
jgi:hypothetical protein